ncbi:MAG: T9SS type A sorting domain-containing protein [Flavobacteriales bacterium]|nr:T9SS type A sorting domain-containing protein [Flavobacteriales bacterium]HPF89361.1 T9SS type A sorting domain-containing protein [Flavobacteriales bacterium]
MKLATLSASALLPVALLAQSVTVTTGPGSTIQTYYSLEQGEQSSIPLADWDLAFEINAFNSSILVNTALTGEGPGAGRVKVYETNVTMEDWDLLTVPDLDNWIEIQNSEVYWSAGALTHGNDLDDPLGLSVGWGTYNPVTHTIIGTKIYVIEDTEGGYKKLRINSLASGTYSFTYAGIDGSDQQEATLLKSAFNGKNFGYYSFATGGTVDPEPLATNWDLLFTKYISMVPTAYPVTGVLQNKEVSAMQVDGVPTSEAMWNSADLDTAINVIGSDWKSYNMSAMQYEYVQDRTYFVQDRSSNIWKLVFTGYGGGTTGDITFNQELVSSVSVDEDAYGQLAVYPNPVVNGQLNLVLGEEIRLGRLSILDGAGRLVQSQVVNSAGALNMTPIDLGGLQAGLYVARLEAEGRIRTARIVVE